MSHRHPFANASRVLATLGLFLLAAESGCSSAPNTTLDAPNDASVEGGSDASVAPDATPDDDGSVLEAGSCPPGTANCSGDPRIGCETKLDDPKHCGSCMHDCIALAHVTGATTCSAGKCVVPASACAHGYAHCSSNTDDGCETDLSKPATCGACTTSCSGGTPVCAGGTCSSNCPTNASTLCSGSCVDTTSSPTNCNACGHACTAPAHGQSTCASSVCGFACNASYHACGGACADDTSPLTCGTSCTPCSAPANAHATCNGTTCDFACDAGYHRCGSSCARDDDATACGASCTACTVPSGAGHATCSSAMCGIVCDSGNHLCGTACDSNGSTASCGTSCTPCVAPPSNGHSTCDGTSCGIACDSSYHQCGNNCSSNNLPSSCGTLCTPCPTAPHAQSTCNGTSCGLACDAGWAVCGGNPSNGCLINLTSDTGNCGSCGHGCLGGTCNAGTCQPDVIATVNSAVELLLDSTYLFFRAQSAVYRVNKSTRTVQSIFQEPTLVSLAAIGTDGTYLFASTLKGKLYRFDKDGGNAMLLYDTGTTTPMGPVTGGNGRVFFQNKTDDVASVLLDGTGFLALNLGTSATAIVADNIDAYFAGNANGAVGIHSFFNTGIDAAILPEPLSLAMDGSYFYWTTGGTSPIVGRIARNGSGRTTLVSSADTPRAVAVDAAYVYYTLSSTIARVPISGGTPVTLASSQASPYSIAVDATAVYWVTSGNQVMLLAK